MKYLKRKIDEFLMEWKVDPGKKPLIVKGARQVGKTESVTRFGRENYQQVIYINFVEEPKYKMILEDGYSTSDIIKNISRIDPSKRFVENETLFIFDEIQEMPDIATSLKFFKLDGRYDVICSGSLLGINYRQIESNSVGYKTDYEMNSMDFEEFLWAKGYGKEFAEDLLAHMKEEKPLSELTMSVCRGLFLDYCILGGMPAVVEQYIENGTFEGTLDLQRQLLADYKEDIRKYAEGMDQTRILNVFNQIAPQLARDNKKFQLSRVARGARFKDYRGCIEWLADAGVVNICYCLGFPELPLKGNYDDTKFKLYFKDTGLLVAMLDDESQDDLRANRNLGVYKGALYENIVGEALVKAGYGLYYYKREDSTLEEDFFVRTRENLVPVEVKASGGRSKSLRTLIDSEKYGDIRWGIKLCEGNIGYSDGIYTFPYFCTFLLKEYLRER
ncbi:AAA family ATPase [Lachnoclostridium sp. An169]|uniref:ATP-binding protein n=1 Tax=Lachnoclostridium sp. An169 TaxID=1965569 RepID=UPI000B38F86F|nr:ATP-binding protein [Lachnoclostridium sp. An169]OUP83586.1 AAA family ATPase [Lachnoclostridium sp. An169]HJA68081.1 ATP-binding protein [Candidatus Mediterraneibacter cottocaccae]